jgi:hypothetical protein
MKAFILALALLSPVAALADGGVVVDAGVVDVVLTSDASVVEVAPVSDAGVAVAPVVDAGLPVIPSLDEPLTSAKGFYHAVTTGNGWLAAMFILFFFVGLIRIVGKRVHAMIPDDTKHPVLRPIEKALFFIFDTKIGGWLMNWLAAIGGCLSTAAMAGLPVDAAAWKVAIMASTGGTALIELKDDVMEWWDAKNAAKKEEEAKKAAVVAPVTPADPPPAAPPTDPDATPPA